MTYSVADKMNLAEQSVYCCSWHSQDASLTFQLLSSDFSGQEVAAVTPSILLSDDRITSTILIMKCVITSETSIMRNNANSNKVAYHLQKMHTRGGQMYTVASTT